MLPTTKRQNNWLPNIFNDFFKDEWCPMCSMPANTPAINVKENEQAFLVEIATPGITKDDIKVRVNDQNQLEISVEKKQENEAKDKHCKYLRREFNYMHFEHALQLPENVNKTAITAKVCSGVLHIELPKLTIVPEKKTTHIIDVQ